MDRPDVVPITPDDDRFHPYTDHPFETETFWVSFHDAERRLGGWFYNQVLFNQGVSHGGAWVWDDSPAAALHEVHLRDLPLVDADALDLRDVVLPNGNHLEMLAPLRRYRVRRNDPGAFEADLTFDGVIAPHSHPLGVAPFWKGRHFDQPMHVTGQIELHGKVIAIDSYSVRDRSWGPRPGPRAPGTSRTGPRRERSAEELARPPFSPWGIGYVFATQDADESFLAYTLPCFWDGEVRDDVTTGYLVRDGRYGLLVGGHRRCEFDPEHGWMRRIWLDAVDEHGRELSAVGELLSHHGASGQGTGYFHWRWNGAEGYGEDQSRARDDLLRALDDAGLWVARL